MAPIQQLGFEDFPDQQLRVWLFCDVPNSRELQAAMVAGELPFSVAILNASLVPSLFALHVAAHKSLLADSRNALRTRSLYTEVIYNISGSKHIAESLKRFGVNDECKHLLFATFETEPDAEQRLNELVQGTLVEEPARLPELADMDQLKKFYKYTEAEVAQGTLETVILTQLAAREGL